MITTIITVDMESLHIAIQYIEREFWFPHIFTVVFLESLRFFLLCGNHLYMIANILLIYCAVYKKLHRSQ